MSPKSYYMHINSAGGILTIFSQWITIKKKNYSYVIKLYHSHCANSLSTSKATKTLYSLCDSLTNKVWYMKDISEAGHGLNICFCLFVYTANKQVV